MDKVTAGSPEQEEKMLERFAQRNELLVEAVQSLQGAILEIGNIAADKDGSLFWMRMARATENITQGLEALGKARDLHNQNRV